MRKLRPGEARVHRRAVQGWGTKGPFLEARLAPRKQNCGAPRLSGSEVGELAFSGPAFHLVGNIFQGFMDTALINREITS